MLIPAQLSTFFSRAREDARSPGLCRWAVGLGDEALCKREVTLLRPGSRHPLTRTSTRGRRGRNGVTVSVAAPSSAAVRSAGRAAPSRRASRGPGQSPAGLGTRGCSELVRSPRLQRRSPKTWKTGTWLVLGLLQARPAVGVSFPSDSCSALRFSSCVTPCGVHWVYQPVVTQRTSSASPSPCHVSRCFISLLFGAPGRRRGPS